MTLWLVAALGIGFHFGGEEVRRFERLAADDIRSRLERVDGDLSVRARVDPIGALLGRVRSATIRGSRFSTVGLPLFTEPNRPTSGQLGELRLELEEFDLSGLRVQRLDAVIPNCRFDLGLALREQKIRLSQSGEGWGSVTVREVDLERFVLRKFREIKEVKVRIDRDKVFVEGIGEFLVVRTEFWVVANLKVEDGRRLVLDGARILFDGARADPISSEALLKALNPVLDLDRDLGLHGAVDVQRLSLRDGLLTAWGRTRIPNLPLTSSPPGANSDPWHKGP
jgi:hypothetical protein